MHNAYANDTASRKLNILFGNSGINTRYSVISDFDEARNRHTLFNGNAVIPAIDKRLDLFREKALPLAFEAIKAAFEQNELHGYESDITHLITVTCTGLHAPGLDAAIIELMNLPRDIFHTSVNFLGCNAAFPALKIADMIAKTDENSKILIVCVELCTLHFKPKNNNDNLLSNAIFGDGAAAAIVVPDKFAGQQGLYGLTINGFYSLLLNRGKELMGWNINPSNFEMVLDSSVPAFIGDMAIDIMLKAGKKLNFDPDHISKWAVHPGGKKILDTLKKQLHLNETDLYYSYKILEEYGNMSSSTILFVLNKIMRDIEKPGETVFSLGFGPGLNIETSLLTYAK